MSDQSFCTNCGSPIQNTAVFCTNCGKSLKATPAPKTNKSFYKHWWTWAIAAGIIVFGLIGQHAGGSDQSATSNNTSPSTNTASTPSSTTKQTPAPASTPAPAPVPAKIGETVQVGKFAVRIDGVQKTQSVGDNFMNKQAQGQYWLIKVDILNNDTKARTIDTSMFQLIDANGATYDADAEASVYANGENNFFLKDVNPHLAASGIVVFDMPKEAKNITMKVDSGVLFAGGESVKINLGQ